MPVTWTKLKAWMWECVGACRLAVVGWQSYMTLWVATHGKGHPMGARLVLFSCLRVSTFEAKFTGNTSSPRAAWAAELPRARQVGYQGGNGTRLCGQRRHGRGRQGREIRHFQCVDSKL
jgi:hypothetical protein